MASVDSLPADQRAVLQLVLQRGRSYEDIARLLSIDRAAVRQRALAALDTLGPRTGVPDERRAMITDYLLGQLPDEQRERARTRLAENPGERAWARVIASELSPMAGGALPEIPVETDGAAAAPEPARDVSEAGTARADEPVAAGHEPRVGDDDTEPATPSQPSEPVAPVAAVPVASTAAPEREGHADADSAGRRPGGGATGDTGLGGAGGGRTSRLGGLILIAGVIVVVIVVALVLVLSGGSSKHNNAVASSSSTTSTAAASSSSSTSTAARVVAQINLTPPKSGSKAAGIAEVLNEGANDGIAIVAQNVPANATKPPNAYAVWLYNSPNDSHILGFVNPGVGKDGRLSTAGGLPTNASHYKQLIVTVETRANPKTPGTIVLQGALTGLS